MILYYFDGCKEEAQVVIQLLNWLQISVVLRESLEVLKFSNGKSHPVLMDADRILGVGFFGIVKHLESRGHYPC